MGTDHRSRHAQVLQRQTIVNMRLLLLSWFCFQVSLAQSVEDLPEKNLKVEEVIEKVGPVLLSIAKKSLDDGMADFTQSMYLHLSQQPDVSNFVFSPLSIHSSLSMLYLGTTHGSNTSDELAIALGIINNRNFVKIAYNDLVKTYREEENFKYGNNFWVQNGFSVNSSFAKLVKDNMNSDVDNLDFADAESVRRVNNWVANMTGGNIDNLVDSFSADTSLFIANALYFNEKWEIPFLSKDTVTGEKLREVFRTSDNRFVNAPFIEQESSRIGYEKINSSKSEPEVITIPYENQLFEMQIILPKDVNGMKRLESEMLLSNTKDLNNGNAGFFNIFTKNSREEPDEFIEDVFLKMPTFKIKTDMDAAEPLRKLGVRRGYNQDAELEGISSAPISVSRIKHTSLVEVTKEGTEGAAATGVEIALFSAAFGEQKDIVVDRPFIFIVQDKKNHIPVLVGKITDPTQNVI